MTNCTIRSYAQRLQTCGLPVISRNPERYNGFCVPCLYVFEAIFRETADHYTVIPPSTVSTWPVMKLAASLARNRTASATSCGSPSRPSGISFLILSKHLFAQGGGHVGGDEARGHGIDRDVAAGQFLGHGPRQADHARLRGRIIGLPGVAHQPRHAGDIDDPPAVCLNHRLGGGAGEEKRAAKIDIHTASHCSSFIRRIMLSRVMPALLTRICEPPHILTTSSTTSATRCAVGDVAGQGSAVPPAARMAVDGSCQGLDVDVDAGHLGAGGGQRLGDRAAQAAGGPGDNGRLAGQDWWKCGFLLSRSLVVLTSVIKQFSVFSSVSSYDA